MSPEEIHLIITGIRDIFIMLGMIYLIKVLTFISDESDKRHNMCMKIIYEKLRLDTEKELARLMPLIQGDRDDKT